MACISYVPEYDPSDLPWYRKDDLMTWCDQKKCEDLLRDLKGHFKNMKIVNFDIIRKQAAGEKASDETLKKYQTVREERTSRYPTKYLEKFLSHTFKTDIHFEKNVIKNHFKYKW